jgi:hypothetical protein
MNPIDWLCVKAPGFDQLTKKERDAIMHFALLWSFFETTVFNTSASARSITDVSKRWEEEGLLKEESFNDCLSYFKGRYIDLGKFTPPFSGLNFRNNDNQDLVKAVLLGNDRGVGDIVAALLIIVYRLRNNLFHGLKWVDGIRGQLCNFKKANSLLMIALDVHISAPGL